MPDTNITELMRSPDFSDEMEHFLYDFVEWMKTKDMILCEAQYTNIEFDVTEWARKTYSKQGVEYTARECPECGMNEFPFVKDDYLCTHCRAVEALCKYDPFSGSRVGVTPDGFDIWLDDDYDNRLMTRVPSDYFSPNHANPASLIYQYVRYKRDTLTSYAEKAKVISPPPLPPACPF